MAERHSLGRWIFIQILILLAVYLAAEGILRLVSPPAGPDLPTISLLERTDEGATVRLRPKFATLANPAIGELIPLGNGRQFTVIAPMRPFEVEVPRPEGVFRFVLLGSSPAYGLEDTPPLAELIEEELAKALAPQRIEAVDLSNVNMQLEKIRLLVPDTLSLAPQVVVVALSGAWPTLEPPRVSTKPVWQEKVRRWFGRSYLVRWLFHLFAVGEAQAQERAQFRFLPDPKEFPDDYQVQRANVALNLLAEMRRLRKEQIVRIVATLRDAGVRTIIVGSTSNVVNFYPVLSMHTRPLDSRQMADFSRHYHQGNTHDLEGDCRQAVGEWELAEEIDPAFASLHFRKAQCQQKLGRQEEAARSFLLARECDLSPERASAAGRDPVEEISAAGARYVDTDSVLAAATGGGLLGALFFRDMEHLRPAGQRVVAQAVASAIELQAAQP